jgi:hypothetical protein
MRPPSARSLRTPPSVLLKRDLVTVSRWLTVDLTTTQSFVNSLWPSVHKLVWVVGDYADLAEDDLTKIEISAMELLWKHRDGLKGLSEPGKLITHAILLKIRLFFKENGLESKWNEFGDEMRKYVYLAS